MKFFNPHEDIKHSKTNLPHWEQIGACYFLTFRLADSIPAKLLREWKADREAWVAQHPEPWSKSIEAEYHKRFSSKTEAWLDSGYGECLLKDPAARDCATQAMRHFDGDRYVLHACVIMPNHVHALLSLHPKVELSKIIHSWKSFSAKQINALLKRTGSLWQRDYFDRLVRDQQHFSNCLRYIRRNPEKARLRDETYAVYEDEIAQSVSPHPRG